MSKRKMMINVTDYDFAQMINPVDNLKADVFKPNNYTYIFNISVLNSDDKNATAPIWTIDTTTVKGNHEITNIHTPHMMMNLYSDTDNFTDHLKHALHMVKGFFVSYDFKDSIMNFAYLKKQAKKQILAKEIAKSRKQLANKQARLAKLNK